MGTSAWQPVYQTGHQGPLSVALEFVGFPAPFDPLPDSGSSSFQTFPSRIVLETAGAIPGYLGSTTHTETRRRCLSARNPGILQVVGRA
jgi:hypothetical protein